MLKKEMIESIVIYCDGCGDAMEPPYQVIRRDGKPELHFHKGCAEKHFNSTLRVRKLIEDALDTDGAHHKQWYLVEIAKELGYQLDFEDIDPGIAP